VTGPHSTPSQDGPGSSGGRPAITLVAAVAGNGTIGADGGLPWHLPADLKRFKALTMGHPMIMGRRTFESIGRVLPGRRTIVVTRDPSWGFPGVTVAHSVRDAIAAAVRDSEPSDDQPAGAGESRARPTAVMVVGGGEVYRQTIADADRLEITHVDAEVAGDTTFPDIDPQVWRATVHGEGDGYRFVTYDRRTGAADADAEPVTAVSTEAAVVDPTSSDSLPVSDLRVLLTSMRPHLHDGEYVFCSLPGGTVPDGVRPVATMREEEGLTVVLPAAEALAAELDGSFRCAWITLEVRSALYAVGLTAAVATALTTDGIACNVIAGAHHDHLFVPYDAAARAIAALEALAHTRV
jgi:dihydrofolate reductase